MMVVATTRAALVKQLEMFERIVSRKQTIPVLSNVLFRLDGSTEAILMATDLEVAIRSRYAVGAAEVGAFTVPGRRLLDLVRTLPEGDLRLDASTESKVVVTAANYNATLQTLPATDFPTIAVPPEGARVLIPRGVLRDLVRRTRFAVTSSQEGAYFLHGALLEVGDNLARMVSTDGHRLAKAEAPIEAAHPVIKEIMPKITLDALWPLLDGEGPAVGFAVGESHLFFEVDDRVMLVARRMEAKFPQYARVIPAPVDAKLTVARAPLADALRRAALMGTNQKALFELGPDQLRVSAESADVGTASDQLAAEYSGPEIRIAVNAAYVSQFIDVVGTERVTVEAQDELRPMVWRPAGGAEYLYVVMPMRV